MEDSSGTWSLGTRLKCHVAAIGEKNRQVCPHPVGGVNRSRFSLAINSRRSANKIARCVAGLRVNFLEKTHKADCGRILIISTKHLKVKMMYFPVNS